MQGATISAHVSAMRQIEQRIFGRQMDFPVAWPHDGGVRDRNSGEAISRMYKNFGLRMMAEHATHANIKGVAATSLEAGFRRSMRGSSTASSRYPAAACSISRSAASTTARTASR